MVHHPKVLILLFKIANHVLNLRYVESCKRIAKTFILISLPDCEEISMKVLEISRENAAF